MQIKMYVMFLANNSIENQMAVLKFLPIHDLTHDYLHILNELRFGASPSLGIAVLVLVPGASQSSDAEDGLA